MWWSLKILDTSCHRKKAFPNVERGRVSEEGTSKKDFHKKKVCSFKLRRESIVLFQKKKKQVNLKASANPPAKTFHILSYLCLSSY